MSVIISNPSLELDLDFKLRQAHNGLIEFGLVENIIAQDNSYELSLRLSFIHSFRNLRVTKTEANGNCGAPRSKGQNFPEVICLDQIASLKEKVGLAGNQTGKNYTPIA
jgi:hypothetical protein